MPVRKTKKGYKITGADAVTYVINAGLVGNGGNTWPDFYKSLDKSATNQFGTGTVDKVAIGIAQTISSFVTTTQENIYVKLSD